MIYAMLDKLNTLQYYFIHTVSYYHCGSAGFTKSQSHFLAAALAMFSFGGGEAVIWRPPLVAESAEQARPAGERDRERMLVGEARRRGAGAGLGCLVGWLPT